MWTGKYCERCDKLGFDKCYCNKTHPVEPGPEIEKLALAGKMADEFAEWLWNNQKTSYNWQPKEDTNKLRDLLLGFADLANE